MPRRRYLDVTATPNERLGDQHGDEEFVKLRDALGTERGRSDWSGTWQFERFAAVARRSSS
jgi:hypothetical protein